MVPGIGLGGGGIELEDIMKLYCHMYVQHVYVMPYFSQTISQILVVRHSFVNNSKYYLLILLLLLILMQLCRRFNTLHLF